MQRNKIKIIILLGVWSIIPISLIAQSPKQQAPVEVQIQSVSNDTFKVDNYAPSGPLIAKPTTQPATPVSTKPEKKLPKKNKILER